MFLGTEGMLLEWVLTGDADLWSFSGVNMNMSLPRTVFRQQRTGLGEQGQCSVVHAGVWRGILLVFTSFLYGRSCPYLMLSKGLAQDTSYLLCNI